MTRGEIRFAVNKMLDKLEWLDLHASVRQPKHREKLATVLRDMEKLLLKIIEAPIHMKELAPGERETEDKLELE